MRLVCGAVGIVLTIALFQPDAIAQQAPADSVRACVIKRSDPSCFYKRDPSAKNKKVLVFIHGIFGGAATTWGDPRSSRYWPAMTAIDSRFTDFDIYLVNYATPFLRNGPSVEDVTVSELNRMTDLGMFRDYDDIHIVAHSMGGIVGKNMIVKLSEERGPRFGRIRSIVYLSTPALGAEIASLAAILGNLQARSIESAKINDFIKGLENLWVGLMLRRNTEDRKYPISFCAYETLSTFGVAVVSMPSANSRCDNVLHPMVLNHSGVATPTSVDRDPYLWVMARLAGADEGTRRRLEAESLVTRARALVREARRAEARAAYASARALYAETKDPEGEAVAMIGLGDVERLDGNLDAARSHYERALALAKRTAIKESSVDSLQMADALSRVGDLHRVLGRNEAATAAYGDAMTRYKAAADAGSEEGRRGMAAVYRGSGYLSFRIGRNDDARKAFRAAEQLYQGIHDLEGQATVVSDIGDLEAEVGNFGEAQRRYDEALKMAGHAADDVARGHVLVGLGDLHRRQRQYPRAVREYEKAIQLFQDRRVPRGEGNAILGLGDVARARGDRISAAARYKRAMEIYVAEDNRIGVANVLLARGYLERGRDAELARQYFYQAAGVYGDLGMVVYRDRAISEARRMSRS